MLVAIDIDGTLTAYPAVFRQFVELFQHSPSMSDEFVFLTGHSCDYPEMVDMERLRESRMSQIESLIGQRFLRRSLHICVGRNSDEVAKQKAEFCKQHGVDMFIDDSPNYIRAVRAASPKTLCLLVSK